MRTQRTIPLLIAAISLIAGCAESGDRAGRSPGTAREWEPDDALQRAQRALKRDKVDVALIDSGAHHVASGLDKTLDTPGNLPYRLDITCDSDDIRALVLTLARGGANHTWAVTCGKREAERFNIPFGKPIAAKISPAKDDATGLIAWRLVTLNPQWIKGCKDAVHGCRE